MRWFKHDVDMHTDFKIRELIEKHGIEGYAIWSLCLELIGKEGVKISKNGSTKVGRWCLNGQRRWKHHLLNICQWSDEGKLDAILLTLADLGLICSKSLKYGTLYVPNFRNRADDYTSRIVRTVYEQGSDNVHLEQNRTDKIRREEMVAIQEHYVEKKGYNREHLTNSDWLRFSKGAKLLFLKAGSVEEAKRAIDWVAEQSYIDWTIETAVKKFPDYFKTLKTGSVAELEKQLEGYDKKGHTQSS